MNNIKKCIFKTKSFSLSFQYNFAERSNSTTIACARDTYPNILYANTNTPVIGTQFYTDSALTIPFSFPELTTFYFKRDTNELLYPIFNDGKLVGAPIDCSEIEPVPVYTIQDCRNGDVYSTAQSAPFSVGTVVEVNIGSGNPLPRCGTILTDDTLGIPNGILGLSRDCSDNVHCDLS